ncbi:MAG TPA: (Fe-S)-binding protein [bacterium]|nr:(Fe-S)-binding protein [bacterium]
MDTETAKKVVEEKIRIAPAEIEKKKQYAYYLDAQPKGDLVGRFLEAFAAVLEHTNYRFAIDMMSKVSTHCGRCATACPVYQVTGEDRDIPCNRSGLLLDVYRRHFTLNGWLKAKVLGDGGITEGDIDRMADDFYRCTACRRCNIFCPMGVDHGLITHLGRYILSEIGIIPKALLVATREQIDGFTGNTSAIPVPALKDTLEFLEEELMEKFNVPIKFPIDQEGAEYVFFPAVSDYLLEADTLMGNAAVMHATRGSWTIGTLDYDGINYGLFYSDYVLGRVVRMELTQTRKLKGKKIFVGECGHATRSAWFGATYNENGNLPVVNCMEYAYEQLRAGKLKLRPDVVTEKITYHDPCNIARAGKIVHQPREVIKSFCKNFIDMVPNGRLNYCCGGGGGTVSIDELHEFRMMIAGKKKADQMRETGAELVITPCANCKKQVEELIAFYELPMQKTGLHDQILRAIVIEG